MRRHFPRVLLLSILLAAPISGAASAQRAPAEPRDYTQAMALLATGDTAGAIDRLRAATRASSNFGPAFLRLGSLLGQRAGEVEGDFAERVEAERALERAARLMPGDPEVLLEHGLLLRKKHMRQDALRVLERAWELAERRGEELSPELRARLHYGLAQIYETWWEDWQNLIEIPRGATGIMYCRATFGPTDPAAAAVACPEAWNAQVQLSIPYADLKSEERVQMMGHYRLALRADPGLVDAAVGLLGHLADTGEWEEYDQVARRLVLAAPTNPRSYLFLGLGLHERGRVTAADSAFDRALALLPREDRIIFEDITRLLPLELQNRYVAQDSTDRALTSAVFFTARDPLWLTSVNERRLEHYARLAWAELKFAAPESGLRGWDSDRGQIYVRYGAPTNWYQVGYGRQPPSRTIYWSYWPGGPVFVFDRQLTYRRARMNEASRIMAADLAVDAPEMYRPRTISEVYDVAHQTVRFRGRDPHLTRVDVYGELPLNDLADDPSANIETGIFVFDQLLEPLWDFRQTLSPERGRLPITYRYQVPPGFYLQGVEARAEGPDSVARPVARGRSRVEAVGYPAGRLGVSDILLARSVVPRMDRPQQQQDFAILPNPSMTYSAEEPIAFYFELYNLLPDDEQFASYEVEMVVSVREIERTGPALVQALGDLADRWGFTPEGSEALQLRFRKEANVLARDMIPEYFQIHLPGTPAGRYGLAITVRDRNADIAAVTEREFRIR